jgi:hypothetical protein
MDSRDLAKFIGCCGWKAEELKTGGDLFKQHIGAEAILTSAFASNGVISSFMTTSPTSVEGIRCVTSMGSGSPAFMPSGVALTTMSNPAGSFDPSVTFCCG